MLYPTTAVGGGAERVTVLIVNILSELGNDVTLYVSEPLDLGKYLQYYNSAFKCNMVARQSPQVRVLPRRYQWLLNELYFKNVGAEIVFDLSPTIFPLYVSNPDVAYFHWLPSDTYLMRRTDRGFGRVIFYPYHAITSCLTKKFFSGTTIKLTDSKFTQLALANIGLDSRVVYTPTDLNLWTPEVNTKRNGVVSFSRFSVDYPPKRQDWVMSIANSQGVDLLLAGSCRSERERSYLDELRQAGQRNVQFLVNAPFCEIRETLWSRKVYLHASPWDPFPSTVIEAIAAGCLPLVFDGGGVTEIVPFPQLWFSTIEEGRAKLTRALAGDLDHYLPLLPAHIEKFGIGAFKERLKQIMVELSSRNL